MSDVTAQRPPTVFELGLMQGSPPPDDAVVGPDDWWKPPYLRWSFLHTREVVPSALVSRGDGPVWDLPRDEHDLLEIALPVAGDTWTLRQVLDTTYVDALMVVHRGHVIFEHYGEGMGPHTRHLCQSVSKSLTAALAGVLVADGRLALESTVPDVIEELGGTCWDGCTIEHLLDMRAGVAFDESDYEDPESESWRGFRALGWMPPLDSDPSPTGYIASMRNQTAHGGDFEYRSILTDVLGWVIERATGERFADVFAREVWAPMGAAADADLLLGPAGFPLVDGGFCVTLADLARFGLLHLSEGVADGRRVLPAGWSERLTVPDPGRAAAFPAERERMRPGSYYRDQWWVLDPYRRIRSGFGIHGQQVLVHGGHEVVVARFSTQPRPIDDSLGPLAEGAMLALCDEVAAGPDELR
jgi:CubicO group peptidase (beta-lactamase class C family)